MAQSGVYRFTSVVALMFVMALSCVHADVLKSDGGCEKMSSLRQRMDQLEGLLFEQAEKLSGQEILLRAQAEQLIHQDSSIRQLKETVNEQDTSMHELKATVNELKMKQTQSSVGSSAMQQSKDNSNESTSSLPTNEGNQSPAVLTTSASQDDIIVQVRSDDAGPLDVVVSQMGQQVTELSADIQALKTQTTSDIQTLKTQTTSDIHTLRIETTSDIQTLRDANSQQDQQIQDAQTSTYVHWGNSQCSSSSQLVYSGVVGGSHNNQPGAATNYLCLTMSPVLSDHSLPGNRAYLYGGEYQTYDSHMDMDPVCAVCRSRHSTTIMIPGTNVCTQGWQRQYSGYLMAGYYNAAAGSEFICVDSAMVSRPGTNRSNDGKLLYYTVTQCGSLPCEPYVNNKIVTCVVCSQ